MIQSFVFYKQCSAVQVLFLFVFTSHLVAKSVTPMTVAAALGSPKIDHMSDEPMLAENKAADEVGGDEQAASQIPAAEETSGSAAGSTSPPKEVAKAKAKGKAKGDNKKKVMKKEKMTCETAEKKLQSASELRGTVAQLKEKREELKKQKTANEGAQGCRAQGRWN